MPPSVWTRRTTAASRSAPSMSCIGQRVFKPRALSSARVWMRADRVADSSRTTARNRSRMAVSTSSYCSISTAACKLAREPRLPSVSACSSWSRRASCSNSRVTFSSINTKPSITGAVPTAGCVSTGARTAAMLARNNCPLAVLVTNCAEGLSAPRARRPRMCSSA